MEQFRCGAMSRWAGHPCPSTTSRATRRGLSACVECINNTFLEMMHAAFTVHEVPNGSAMPRPRWRVRKQSHERDWLKGETTVGTNLVTHFRVSLRLLLRPFSVGRHQFFSALCSIGSYRAHKYFPSLPYAPLPARMCSRRVPAKCPIVRDRTDM